MSNIKDKYNKELATLMTLRTMVLATSGIFIAGLLLFYYKLQQTSDFAMRYDTQAQEQIGMWGLMLTGIFFVALLFSGYLINRKKAFRSTRAEYSAYLASTMAAARDNKDTSAEIETELALRELQALKWGK
ncbi:MAG: hypothetical protein CMK70_03055 [Pseudohongiella sp.]|nr:hypothetical protein [Pseudohongiella sp.]|tara:strand:+ start:6858 stop:7250 length:393 start_codon:yes stop_codon:yes gene_type:complete